MADKKPSEIVEEARETAKFLGATHAEARR
jgi:hypothetical protein